MTSNPISITACRAVGMAEDRLCRTCDQLVPYQGRGQPRNWCDEECKKVWRRRQAKATRVRTPRLAFQPHPPARGRECRRCLVSKPASDFTVEPRSLSGLKTWCKACYAIYNADRKERTLQQSRRSRYGISIPDQDAMWAEQRGCCASCGHPFARLGEAHLDHDHTTGRVRAFLCGPCNHIVGRCGEDVDHLVAVAEYLIRQRVLA